MRRAAWRPRAGAAGSPGSRATCYRCTSTWAMASARCGGRQRLCCSSPPRTQQPGSQATQQIGLLLQRVLYKMESVSGSLTAEEAAKAARKLAGPYAGTHDV